MTHSLSNRFSDEDIMRGCLLCIHGKFLAPKPDSTGKLQFGSQEVQCAKFGIVQERTDCEEFDTEQIRTIEL